MNRFLPRYTLRRLMGVVAIVAIVLGVAAESARLARRRAKYRGRVAIHAREMTQLNRTDSLLIQTREKIKRDGIASPYDRFGLSPRTHAPHSLIASFDDRRTAILFRWEWHKRMKAKYERAAERPWLAVDPDPPEPR